MSNIIQIKAVKELCELFFQWIRNFSAIEELNYFIQCTYTASHDYPLLVVIGLIITQLPPNQKVTF
jgi:hypothetical protein